MQILNKIGLPGVTNVRDILNLPSSCQVKVRRRRVLLMAAAVYVIWTARNESIFDNKVHNLEVLSAKTEFLLLRALHLARIH